MNARYFGMHTKPVQKSLEILDSIGAIEYVEGSSKSGWHLLPFTVKLKPGFECLTDDGILFCCHATKVHAAARKATGVGI